MWITKLRCERERFIWVYVESFCNAIVLYLDPHQRNEIRKVEYNK